MSRMTHSMHGKTVLITGGTGGIGRAAAIGLASMGARVGITGRDRARAERAAGEIRRESGSTAVDVFVADMSSQAEVRRLAAEVLAVYPRIDVLLNNVGGFWANRHVTADGPEHTFALNHLAPFLLTSTGPGGHRVVRGAGYGEDRLRRPDGRAEVLRTAGLQPIEAGQCDVHL
jgi:NAD(P)-dependent dehydrogenase (short-subunit alcohol dehydrogenase family)